MHRELKWCFHLLAGLMLAEAAFAGTTIYVDHAAAGADSGLSWTDAYTNLQSALTGAGSSDEIWVAEGTYKPTSGLDRTNRFSLKARVAVYGGFTNGMGSAAERDWDAYPSILSGDIGISGVETDNCYHIVYCGSSSDDAVLDGFTLKHGCADDPAGGANSYGGAIFSDEFTNIVRNCSFFGNMAARRGGAIYISNGMTVSNCRFYANAVTTSAQLENGGGAIWLTGGAANKQIVGCTFSGNIASNRGGALYYNASTVVTLSNCVMCGNWARTSYGSGFYNAGSAGQTAKVANCIFAGNEGSYAVYNYIGSVATFANCTFSGNTNSAMYSRGCNDLIIWNSIFWNNDTGGDGMSVRDCTLTIGFTDLKGGLAGITLLGTGAVTDGGGNLATNPLFADPITGLWTADAGYITNDCVTVLTDSGAAWTLNAQRGRLVNPDTSQALQFYIASNSTTRLYILGDASAVAHNGDAYCVYDYHLKSTTGRWTPLGWTADTTLSPCIDAGDPASDWSLEPRPNGGRINMGAYGNTLQASKSYIPRGTVFRLY